MVDSSGREGWKKQSIELTPQEKTLLGTTGHNPDGAIVLNTEGRDKKHTFIKDVKSRLDNLLDLERRIFAATNLNPKALATLKSSELIYIFKYNIAYSSDLLAKIAAWSKQAADVVERTNRHDILTITTRKNGDFSNPNLTQVINLGIVAEQVMRYKQASKEISVPPKEQPSVKSIDVLQSNMASQDDFGVITEEPVVVVGNDQRVVRSSQVLKEGVDDKISEPRMPVSESVTDINHQTHSKTIGRGSSVRDVKKEIVEFKTKVDQLRKDKLIEVERAKNEREEERLKEEISNFEIGVKLGEAKREFMQYLERVYGGLSVELSIKKAVNILVSIESELEKGVSPITSKKINATEKLGYITYINELANQAIKHRDALIKNMEAEISKAETYTRGVMGKLRGLFNSKEKVKSEKIIKDNKGVVESWDKFIKMATELTGRANIGGKKMKL